MRKGRRSLIFENGIYIISNGSACSKVENSGPLNGKFDEVYEDDMMGQKSYEKAEGLLHFTAIQQAVKKLDILPDDLELMIGSDLLNQIVASTHTARKIDSAFLGIYGACSGFGEALTLGAVLVDAERYERVACTTSSHFSTSERQYRFPLELGTQPSPTSQRTVTASGCSILSAVPRENSPQIVSATIGRVVDMGIKNVNNMGAAMAPAAVDTLINHFKDTGKTPDDYDVIVTGDLGKFGSEIFLHYARENGYELSGKHVDCGEYIFHGDNKKVMGGSGAGCCSSVFNAHFYPELKSGRIKKMLFLPTGALLSKDSPLQGEDIPAVCYAVGLEARL